MERDVSIFVPLFMMLSVVFADVVYVAVRRAMPSQPASARRANSATALGIWGAPAPRRPCFVKFYRVDASEVGAGAIFGRGDEPSMMVWRASP